MDIFIARQPIFDRKQRVFAYELLFRDSLQNFFSPDSDPNEATSRLMTQSFLGFDAAKLTDNKWAFINLPRQVLVDRCIHLLPRELYVPEILEDIPAAPDVVEACRQLKESGYKLALDDFVFHPDLLPLVEYADIIKVDVLQTGLDEQRRLLAELDNGRILFLAEKVETPEAFEQARDMGYSYFQGFFFSEPVLLSKKDIPAAKLQALRLLEQINRPDIDLDGLEEIVKQDVSLSYKLLRYINSPFFGLRTLIHSIHHALTLLGTQEIRKWVNLIVLGQLSDDKPLELLRNTLIRARFCESLAGPMGQRKRSQDLFLLGLFSMIHAILGRPLEELLETIGLADDIKATLLGDNTPLAPTFALAVAYERGDWQRFATAAGELASGEEQLPTLYVEALEWTARSMAA